MHTTGGGKKRSPFTINENKTGTSGHIIILPSQGHAQSERGAWIVVPLKKLLIP